MTGKSEAAIFDELQAMKDRVNAEHRLHNEAELARIEELRGELSVLRGGSCELPREQPQWHPEHGIMSHYDDDTAHRQSNGSSRIEHVHRHERAAPAGTPAPDAGEIRECETPLRPYGELELPDFAVARLLPLGEVTLLAAPGGTYKSTLAALMALHVASGSRLGPLEVRLRGTVVYVTAEDKGDYVWRRLYDAAEVAELDVQAMASRLHVVDVSTRDWRMTRVEGRMVVGSGFAQAIVEAVRPWAPRLVILDTLSRLNGGDESNESLSVLVRQVELIARTLNAACLVLHHVSKEVARHKIADQHSARGGSAVTDNARSALSLTRLDGEPLAVELIHTKFNLSPMASPLVFQREGTLNGGAGLRLVDQDEARERIAQARQAGIVREAEAARKPLAELLTANPGSSTHAVTEHLMAKLNIGRDKAKRLLLSVLAGDLCEKREHIARGQTEGWFLLS